jgi:hypothetical protein
VHIQAPVSQEEMMKMSTLSKAMIAAALLALSACSLSTTPELAPFTSFHVVSDLTMNDVCAVVPQADIEEIMGVKLNQAPSRFEYPGSFGTSGCWYQAAKDPGGEAHFGYIVLTHVDTYNSQPSVNKQDITGLGQQAYFTNGADARQLWVMKDINTSFVIAFGDKPREDGAKRLAAMLLEAMH